LLCGCPSRGSEAGSRQPPWGLLRPRRGPRGGRVSLGTASVNTLPLSERSGLLAFKGSYLVDPASSHMLVSKIKPCMSKYKQIVRRNCEWLIKSVIVYLMVLYYLDNRGNSRANTC
jgi:hypothetical protein